MVALAYAHLDVFVCSCLGFGCFVSFACRRVKVAIIVVTLPMSLVCVEVAFIDVTSHVCVCVCIVLGVVVCPRVCLACPFVRPALGRRASIRGLLAMTYSRYVDA